MSPSPNALDQITSWLDQYPIVLFMKGTPQAPRCGFSATAAGILNELIPSYFSVDVLADEDIRAGIKAYGKWPTIPQLYVRNELIGGSDIIQALYESAELHELLGVAKPDRTPPAITISDPAARAIRTSLADADGVDLHLTIDARYKTEFQLRESRGSEICTIANGITIRMDAHSAQRAQGLVIDWVDTAQGSGLAVSNPNAPPPVRPLTVKELQQRQTAGDITIIDVRSADERQRAPFAGAHVFEEASYARLLALPKTQALAFLCHHGNASRDAAEHFREHGFRVLFNIDGGIDAWSRDIDPAIPRY